MRICEIDGCERPFKATFEARGLCLRHYQQGWFQKHKSARMEKQRQVRSTPEGRARKRAYARMKRMKYVPLEEVYARSGETVRHVRKAIAQGHLKRKRGERKILISEDSLNRWMGLTDFTPTDVDLQLIETFKAAALCDESYLVEVLWDARVLLENVTDL